MIRYMKGMLDGEGPAGYPRRCSPACTGTPGSCQGESTPGAWSTGMLPEEKGMLCMLGKLLLAPASAQGVPAS